MTARQASPMGPFPGVLQAGNIDLAHRPVVRNADGSISTVRSMSFGDENGREILVPTVSPDGRILPDQEAIDLYYKTGQNLGTFDNPNDADQYAQALHKSQERFYARGDQPMSNAVPAPPPGFVLLDAPDAGAIPPPPPGFEIIPPEEAASEPKRGGLTLNTTAGINDAIYSTLGAPIDLARGAINLGVSGYNAATGSDIGQLSPDSFMGKDWIKSHMGEIHPVLDPDNTEANTTAERVARGAGEGVGYTLAPQAALGGASRAIGGKVLESAAKFVGRPGSIATAGGELVAGGGAGAGATGASEFTPDRYDGLAATIGGLGGGVLGAALASAPMLGRVGWNAARDFVAPMTEAGRQRMAGQRLAEGASDPAAVRRTLDEGVDALVPGSEPTTFQATGDLGIGGMERGAATRRPEPFAERRADQNTARVTALGNIQEKGTPEAVAKAVRDHLARIDDETQVAVDTATRAAQGRTAAIGTGASPEASGTAMRQAVETARSAAKEKERALWNAVDPDGTLALNAGGTKSASRSIIEELPRSAKPMSGEEAAMHSVLQQYDDVVPFSELTALQSRAKAEMRAERLANGETPAYRRMTQLNGAIEKDLETAIAGKVAQEAEAVANGTLRAEDTTAFLIQQWQDDWLNRQAQARASNAGGIGTYGGTGSVAVSGPRGAASEAGRGFGNSARNPGLPGDALQPNFDQAALGRLREARDATKSRVETFDNRTLGPIRRRPGTTSPYDMPAGVVPERIFNAGSSSPEAIKQFRAAVGDEQALQSIQEYAVDRVRAAAMDQDGTINPSRLAAWRRRHQEALKALPELDAKLSDASRASNAVGEVVAARKTKLADAQKGKLGALLNVDDPADIVNTVGSVYGRNDSLNQMARLRGAIRGDSEAAEGLKKATVEYMMRRFVGNTEVATSGQAGLKSDQFQSFIRDNRQALRAAGFPENDLTAMEAIAADLQRANRSVAGVRIPGGSNTAQDTLAASNRSMSNFGRLLSVIGAGSGAYLGGWPASIVGVMGGQAVSAMRRAGLETVDDLIADALLDPRVARVLLSKSHSRPNEGVWKLLASHYGNAARVAAAMGTEKQVNQQQPTPLPKIHLD